MAKVKVTCRYGIEYSVTLKGSYGAIYRTKDLLSRCCCWVCHNHDCKTPRNEKIDGCQESCELWGMRPHPCEKQKQ